MSSSCRRATLKDWWPDLSIGVCRIPLSPSLLRFREAMDSRNSSSECLLPVSTPVTSTCSHSMGTLSALKMVLTASATSAPIPSPVAHHVRNPLVVESSGAHRTGNQSDGVLPAILGRLEDIGRKSGVGWLGQYRSRYTVRSSVTHSEGRKEPQWAGWKLVAQFVAETVEGSVPMACHTG